jgi:hypothetical protein
LETQLIDMEGTAEEIQERLADFAGERLHVTVRRVADVAETASAPSSPRLTITERVLARFRSVPREERAKVPTDLTNNLDHYVYRLPNRRQT